MKHTKAILSVIVIVAVGALILTNWGSLTRTASLGAGGGTMPSATYTPTNQPTNQATSQGYTGTLTLADAITDALQPAQTRTDGTNVAVVYYTQNADGTYRSLATSASNTASIYVTPALKTVWMGVSIPSGQAFYPAIDKMAGTFPRMGLPTWATPNLSNLYQPVFPIDVTNLSGIGTGLTTPSLTIPIQLYTQSSTSNISSNSGLSITNTNHTGVGAGSHQNIEPLTLNFATPATAIALTQFKLVLNDTTLSDFNTGQSYCAVPVGNSVNNINFNSPQVQQIVGASTVTYLFNIATDQTIRTADFLSVPLVGQNWIPFNCYLQTTLSTGTIQFTPSWIWIDMQSATNTISGHAFKVGVT